MERIPFGDAIPGGIGLAFPEAATFWWLVIAALLGLYVVLIWAIHQERVDASALPQPPRNRWAGLGTRPGGRAAERLAARRRRTRAATP